MTQFKSLIQQELDRIQSLVVDTPATYGVSTRYTKAHRNATLISRKQPSPFFSFFRMVQLFLF